MQYEVYNDKSKDLIFEGAYKLEAGKTYYVYSVTSKIKLLNLPLFQVEQRVKVQR